MLEVKTKLPHLQIAVLLAGKVPAEHSAQLQGQMFIAEREWVDFVTYWPGLPPFIKRVDRDEKRIAEIAAAVDDFVGEMDDLILKIKRL